MVQLLSGAQLDSVLVDLPEWSADSARIIRKVALPSFTEAIGVVDRVALVAEDLDHHPDIDIRWRTVTFACSTHSAGGITAKDIELAHRIDDIVRRHLARTAS